MEDRHWEREDDWERYLDPGEKEREARAMRPEPPSCCGGHGCDLCFDAARERDTFGGNIPGNRWQENERRRQHADGEEVVQ